MDNNAAAVGMRAEAEDGHHPLAGCGSHWADEMRMLMMMGTWTRVPCADQ